MALATAIVQVLAAVFGWLASKGVDQIVGRWVAYIVAAYDKSANENTRKSYSDTLNSLATALPAKYNSWTQWQAEHLKGPGLGPSGG